MEDLYVWKEWNGDKKNYYVFAVLQEVPNLRYFSDCSCKMFWTLNELYYVELWVI